MRGRVAAILILLTLSTGLAATAGAQTAATPAQAPLQFDAASVKPSDPNARTDFSRGINLYPGGRLVLHQVNLKNLVAIAYNLAYWQISGGDAWTANDTFEIEAVPPAALGASLNLGHTWYSLQDPRLRVMLQALLVNRFQLGLHQDSRPGVVYLLQRSRKPLAMTPVAKPDTKPGIGTVGFAGGKWTLSSDMTQLAWFASAFVLRATVTDQTGLKGRFYFREAAATPNPEYTGAGNDASFIAFLHEAGLTLTRSHGPVETVVITHATKPGPN